VRFSEGSSRAYSNIRFSTHCEDPPESRTCDFVRSAAKA
jgi:hypothetical protein